MNSRDWATVFWLVVLLAGLLPRLEIRVSLGSVFRTLANATVLIPLVLLTGYIGALLVGLRRIDFWDLGLLRDTVYWFILTALVLFFNWPKISRPGYLRRVLVQELGAALILSFYLDLYTFHVVVEIILQFLLFLALSIEALAKYQTIYPGAVHVKPLANGFLSFAGLGVFIGVTARIVSRFPEVLTFRTLKELLLPVWLTIGVVPLIFLLGLWMAYVSAFRHIAFRPARCWPKWRAGLALVTIGWLRPSRVAAVIPWQLYKATEAGSFQQARQVLGHDEKNSV
jgi:hypothetical protein